MAQAFTWMYNILCLIIDKCTRELEVGILTLNLAFLHTFLVNGQNTFLPADFCMVCMFSFDSDSFEYLCYGLTAIVNILTRTVRGSTSVIRI